MAGQYKHLYEFGPFVLDVREHLLLRDGEVVALAPKAFDVLVVLVQHSGRLVSKDDLMKAVWRDTIVEEGNLSFNISLIRKALGDSAGEPQYVQTVTRRGYRFIAPVREGVGKGAEPATQTLPTSVADAPHIEHSTAGDLEAGEEKQPLPHSASHRPTAREGGAERPAPTFDGGSVARSADEHSSFPRTSSREPSVKLLIAIAVFFVIGAAYLFWARPFSRLPDPPRPCPKLTTGGAQYYEAEAAELSGDADVDSEHLGYSGDGFVSGYGHGYPGTAATFLVDVSSDGQYRVDLCYANGTGSTKTLSLYVNGEHIKQIRLPDAPRWNTWLTQTESLALRSGRNAISYRKNPNDSGEVNLDFIRIARGE
jgi:DNA-binding winged helix-turn-helix (wHTH) protein